MGDHRISITATFEMHDRKDKIDWWLNWSDDIPERVAAWVEKNKELAMDGYLEEQFKGDERKAAEQEDAERELLAQLKAKYG